MYVKIGCLNFLDSYKTLDASLDRFSATLTFFSPSDANGMGDHTFKCKLAYPYENGQTIERVYKTFKKGREDYISTLKQPCSDFEEKRRTEAVVVKSKVTNLQVIIMLFLENDVLLSKESFQKYIGKCKEALGFYPLYSCSTLIFT